MLVPSKNETTGIAQPTKATGIPLRPLIAVWITVLLGWLGYLTAYSNAPGHQGTAPAYWPSDSALSFNNDGPTLLMFVNPRCPCTRSSLEELSKIVTRRPPSASFYCVFVRPPGVPIDWEKRSLWDQVSRIPFVNRFVDDGGIEAKRFGALTSGAVQLFGPDGRIMFEGGITAARNHSGDNVGATAVVEWMTKGVSATDSTFVFGCSLF